ncbi:MAG: 1-deoxy-D-xylulose-5-phosphate reductoisomerase [Vicinamibacterales bacterium]
MKRIAILGSTGSIGRSALAVVDAHADRLAVVGLAAGSNVEAMAAAVERYRPTAVSMGTAELALSVAETLGAAAAGVRTFASGRQGLVEIATRPDVDLVLCASSGTEALEAVLAAIEAGKSIALANKEVLVMAGALVMRAARRHGVSILPVDSEHNAIHQCLHGRAAADVRRLILTASGGPFRTHSTESLDRVTPADALSHPTWKMGRKITIDSATLMNKGLEVIEAHWLFDVPASAIAVVIHPQSVVHSMVELKDGSVMAQLGVTDMRAPIQYAFSYPERWDTGLSPLDLVQQGALSFEAPDRGRFPCLDLAFAALEAGGASPVVLNAANEVAVAAFLEGTLPFRAISEVIRRALETHAALGRAEPADVEDVRDVDAWARRLSGELIRKVESKV